FLGQNFSKAQDIVFQSETGEREYAWTTSWGVSTRLVGALIMSHSDDDGLVLPPKLAPTQIVILPIYKDDSRAAVMEYIESLAKELRDQTFNGVPLRVSIDDRDLRGGEKKWHHVKRGVPIRLEIGPKDMEKQSVFLGRRDQAKSIPIGRSELIATAADLLGDIQQSLYDRADQLRQDNTVTITDEGDFRDFFTSKNQEDPEIHGGFAMCHFADEPSLEPLLKELKVTIRCIPSENNETPGTCFATGRPAEKQAIFAKAY
ncbi:MAG: His/Gly/Thr/Pro-type tRNA ligase C-terminal domain-containing protein, partial [Planctomycetota bacterium]